MSSIKTPVDPYSRRDLPLEEAFLQATDSTIVVPNALQKALFPRLSTQDTGLLIQTGPGAGRLEAVYVPAITGAASDDQLHRLYIIASDSSPLDDYLCRLVPYARSLSAVRGVPITLFIDGSEAYCRQFLSDGSYLDDVCSHPLDVNVDIAVAHFSSFRLLFFGAGGVHALPGKLEKTDENETQFEARRRDLFYFDEAHSYDREEFTGFVKLVEFLYAEDLDVVVGSITLPPSCREELSFLESLTIDDALYQPPRSIRTVATAANDEFATIVNLIKQKYFESSRAAVVVEHPDQAPALFENLNTLYPQLVFCYHSGQSKEERLKIYAQLRELEKEGEGYLLVTDGRAIESADIDVNLLVTSVCAPESLVRRAGRCNRRGDLAKGELLVVGANYVGRQLPEARLLAYLSALNNLSEPIDFNAEYWENFII